MDFFRLGSILNGENDPSGVKLPQRRSGFNELI